MTESSLQTTHPDEPEGLKVCECRVNGKWWNLLTHTTSSLHLIWNLKCHLYDLLCNIKNVRGGMPIFRIKKSSALIKYSILKNNCKILVFLFSLDGSLISLNLVFLLEIPLYKRNWKYFIGSFLLLSLGNLEHFCSLYLLNISYMNAW